MQLTQLPNCCAVQVIQNLQDHTPHETICRILKPYIKGGVRQYWEKKASPRKLHTLPAFIVFTGVGLTPSGKKPAYGRYGYAETFAEYIEKNKFGVVTASPKKLNRQNYEDHYVTVYTWCPSQPQLTKFAIKEKLIDPPAKRVVKKKGKA